MPEKDALAQTVAEILKDESLSLEERVERMKTILPDSHKNFNNAENQDSQDRETSESNTYDSQTLKLAAIKNKLGIKKK